MNEEEANEKLKSLYRFVVVFIVIVLIAVGCIKFLVEPQSDRTLNLAMNNLATNLSQRSMLVHNLWLTDTSRTQDFHLPSWVKLYQDVRYDKIGFNPKELVFVMSKTGWPKDVKGINRDNSCERLWVGLLGKDIKLFIEEVKVIAHPEDNSCTYHTRVTSFKYNFMTGEVSYL